ncbi:MAG TPA: NF038132 family protein [Methyloversatilis sp.]
MKITPPLHHLLAAMATLSGLCSQAVSAATVAPPSDLADWVCTGSCGSLAQDGDVTLSPLGNAKYGYVTTGYSEAFGVSPLSLSDNKVGAETNGSRIVSGTFSANADDSLNIQFNFVSTDGKGYDDYAWARVLNASDNSLVAWIFTARATNSGSNKIIPGDVVSTTEFNPRDTLVNYDAYEFTSKTANWSALGSYNNICWQTDAKGCGFTGWLESSIQFAQAGSYKLEIGVTNWGDTAYDTGLAFDFQNLSDSRIAAPVPEPASASLFLAGLCLLGFAARRRF